MSQSRYLGQRLSYDGQLCTVRYRGPIKGRKGEWVGVEWDDALRGKNNGSREGLTYFECLSDAPTAGSFIRPSRSAEPPLGFLEALEKKYASGNDPKDQATSENEIRISGKTVEEVGFEKVRRQLANLQELQIVILDGFRIAHLERIESIKSTAEPDGNPSETTRDEIQAEHLNVIELDLSRNLLETWADLAAICTPLKALRSLTLNGNRFRETELNVVPGEEANPFQSIEHLALENTLLSWDDIASLTSAFPSIKSLSISANSLSSVTRPLNANLLTVLNLSSNNFDTLDEIAPLSTLPNLATLLLRDNPLNNLDSSPPNLIRFPALKSLDLSSTRLPNLSSLNPIPSTFPALKILLTKGTPLSAIPSSNLHTIARLATLQELNYQPITPAERLNAEIFYLNTIAKSLPTTDHSDQRAVILLLHPSWKNLCEKHGTPDVTRPKVEAAAGTLGARISEFTFTMAATPASTTQKDAQQLENRAADGQATPLDPASIAVKRKLIPLTVDTYRLTGIVTELFELPPLGCKLIWETGELDPVPGMEDEEGWSVSEDDSDYEEDEKHKIKEKEKGKWMPREVELVNGTRKIGNLVEGKKIRVRVEAL